MPEVRFAKVSRISFLAAFSLLSGCAYPNTTHQFWVAGRADSYTEYEAVPLNTVLANSVGGTVTTVSGDPNKITAIAYGGELGLTEQTKSLVSTLSVYYDQYAPISYTFNSSSYGTLQETMNIVGYGLDATIGYNLWIFRPELSYNYEAQSFRTAVSGSSFATTNSSLSGSVFMVGGGLAIDLPLSNGFHLVAQGDYRVPLNPSSSVSSANSIIAQIGFRIGATEPSRPSFHEYHL